MKGFNFYQDQSAKREWRWNLKDGNHKIVADSGEGYPDKPNCQKGAALFTSLGPTAPIHEKGKPGKHDAVWEYFEDKKGEWRWHFLVYGNEDHLLADSAEGYDSKSNVLRAIENVRSLLREIAAEQGNNGNSSNGNGYGQPTPGGSQGPTRFA